METKTITLESGSVRNSEELMALLYLRGFQYIWRIQVTGFADHTEEILK